MHCVSPNLRGRLTQAIGEDQATRELIDIICSSPSTPDIKEVDEDIISLGNGGGFPTQLDSGSPGQNVTLTLPLFTSTIPGIELSQTWTGSQQFTSAPILTDQTGMRLSHQSMSQIIYYDLGSNTAAIYSNLAADTVALEHGHASGKTAMRIGANDIMDATASGVQFGEANARITTVYDTDLMTEDSATALATQQSIKAYVDSQIGGAGHLLLGGGIMTGDITMSGGSLVKFDANTYLGLASEYAEIYTQGEVIIGGASYIDIYSDQGAANYIEILGSDNVGGSVYSLFVHPTRVEISVGGVQAVNLDFTQGVNTSTLTLADPTTAVTWTLPAVAGTVALTSDTLYGANGTLTSARSIIQAGFGLFINGGSTTIGEIGGNDDYGQLINQTSSDGYFCAVGVGSTTGGDAFLRASPTIGGNFGEFIAQGGAGGNTIQHSNHGAVMIATITTGAAGVSIGTNVGGVLEGISIGTTGTIIGKEAGDRVSFFAGVPVVQPTGPVQDYVTTEAVHNSRLSTASLIDNSGGEVANGTIASIADIALSTADTYTDAAVNGAVNALADDTANAVTELADGLDDVRGDGLNTAGVLNTLIDNLQTLNII